MSQMQQHLAVLEARGWASGDVTADFGYAVPHTLYLTRKTPVGAFEYLSAMYSQFDGTLLEAVIETFKVKKNTRANRNLFDKKSAYAPAVYDKGAMPVGIKVARTVEEMFQIAS